MLCINGTGILNRWLKNITGKEISYGLMNEAAATVKAGCDGLQFLPFGNGAERMLENKLIGAHINNLDLNKHGQAHLYRAAQEGIAFAFRYGLDIMKENGLNPAVIRAGRANMFLSDVFADCFVNTLDVPLELHNCDGSVGAALGAGVGAGIFKNAKEAFIEAKPLKVIEPGSSVGLYEDLYENWKELLQEKSNMPQAAASTTLSKKYSTI